MLEESKGEAMRKIVWTAGALVALGMTGTPVAGADDGPKPMGSTGESEGVQPDANYWVYVLSESSDYIQRVRFGPDGAEVEETLRMTDLYQQSSRADLLTNHEDPHGVQVSPDGDALFFTTGHGQPDGKLWKLEAGTGRLLADPVTLGPFPASMDISPDGEYAYVANFNLHGNMLPSTISAVTAGGMHEAARVESCTMPHGSRFHPVDARHYSVCMMDDQLVEVDTESQEVARRFFLAEGEEGPLDPDDLGFHADLDDPDPQPAGHDDHAHHDHDDPEERELRRSRLPHEHAYHASCSPTWVQPAHDGEHIYVACNGSDAVLEIAYDDWELTRRFETGTGPYNVDVTYDDRLLVVTLKQGDGVEFIDLESGETLAREDTSTRVVHGVALSPDGQYAFISVEGIGGEPGKVDIFHLESFERVASVELGSMASGIAFWRMEEAGSQD